MADDGQVTKVCIDTPPLTITCEQPGGDLQEVITAALALYRDVYTPDMTRPTGAIGFHTDKADSDGEG